MAVSHLGFNASYYHRAQISSTVDGYPMNDFVVSN